VTASDTSPRWQAWQKRARDADRRRSRHFGVAGAIAVLGFVTWALLLR